MPVCDWKEPIDEGEFIVLVVDSDQINNSEVEIQATYASKIGKSVLAMIERPTPPADYMTKLKNFDFEWFDVDDKRSFDRALSSLIMRHKEAQSIAREKIRFVCFLDPKNIPRLMP